MGFLCAIWLPDIKCLVSGIWMILIGIFVIILEGLVCSFVPIFIQSAVIKIDAQPEWLKAHTCPLALLHSNLF